MGERLAERPPLRPATKWLGGHPRARVALALGSLPIVCRLSLESCSRGCRPRQTALLLPHTNVRHRVSSFKINM